MSNNKTGEMSTFRERVKKWVVANAGITQPYKPDWRTRPKHDQRHWSASTTLGYDIYQTGDTIEQAYNNLADFICSSKHYSGYLSKMPSFQNPTTP
jgi:hypothetical protein